jgi:rhodanese-related sulfurtransferase
MYIVMAGTAILAVVVAIYTPTLMNWNGYGNVSVEEASNLIAEKSDLVILDVRTQSEFNDGHIEGAILIPHFELADRLDELDSENEILVYCRTGNRSSTAYEILKTNGFDKLYHMNDGITSWISDGYPVVQ